MKKISLTYVKKIFPKRLKLSNKTDAGKVLVIGGGKGLIGAGILSALAATRSGAGYTHLMSDLTQFPWVKFPDFILHPLEIKELKKLKDLKTFSFAVGPGLGLSKKSQNLLLYLIKNKFEKVALDADALNLLAKLKITKLPSTWTLTPHEGELARLLNVNAKKVKSDRQAALFQAQLKFECHILLKGAETLVVDTNQQIYVISEGTPALAKAGTGDVLLGIIAAMRAQGLGPKESLIVASYMHGWCSQAWKKTGHNDLSLRPTDIIDNLSKFPQRGT